MRIVGHHTKPFRQYQNNVLRLQHDFLAIGKGRRDRGKNPPHKALAFLKYSNGVRSVPRFRAGRLIVPLLNSG